MSSTTSKVVNEIDQKQHDLILHMLLVVYKGGDLKQKLFIRPVLDRFTKEGRITPNQLSWIASQYIKYVA